MLLAASATAQARLWTPEGVQEGSFGGWGAGGPVLDGAAAPADWLAVRFPGGLEAAPGPRPPWTLELVNGSLLPGAPGLGEGDLGSWRLPSGVAFAFDTLWLRRVGRRLPVLQAEHKDLLWLQTPGGAADRLRGWLLAWNAGGLLFEGPAGEAEYPWERIQGLEVLAEEPPELPDSGWAWLCFRGGGFLLVRPLEGPVDRPLRAETPWKTVVELPWTALDGIFPAAGGELLDSGWELLSGPQSSVLDWSPKRGRSVEGRALRVAGQEFPDGIGLRAATTLRFTAAAAGRFVAWVGVDDEVAGYRSPQPLRFRVFLGDHELAVSPPVQAGEPARLLRAEVPGPGELRLVVEPEGRLPFGGHGDWLMPRFLPG